LWAVEELKYAFYGIGESLVMLNMLGRKTVEEEVFQKSKGELNLFQYRLWLEDSPKV